MLRVLVCVAVAGVCGVAMAQSAVGPAPGLWGAKMDGKDMGSFCSKQGDTFAKVLEQATKEEGGISCTEPIFRKDGAKYVGSTTCKAEGLTWTSALTVTGDLNTKFNFKSVSKVEGQTIEFSSDHTRLGNC